MKCFVSHRGKIHSDAVNTSIIAWCNALQ